MRDIIVGMVLAIGGSAYAFSAYFALSIGTPRQMGPGMFPLGLGIALTIIGLGIAFQGYFRRYPMPSIGWRPMIGILGALAAFAATIDIFGLFPAIAINTVLCALAAPGNTIVKTVVIAIFLMAVAWFIFIFILSLPINPLQWRF